MPEEKVGIKAGITAQLKSKDESGKTIKSTFFFPDLDVSVEAPNKEEALILAEKKSAKVKKAQK